MQPQPTSDGATSNWATSDWPASDWAVPVRGDVAARDDLAGPALRWPGDAVVALVTALLVTTAGSAAGLVWQHLAPKLSFKQLAAGSDAAFQAELSADMTFVAVTAVAGVLCALLALLMRAHGPGAVVGLGLGGLAAAFVADRVGYLAQHDATFRALRAVGYDPHQVLLGAVDFRLRTLGLVVVWPLAAIGVHTLAQWLRHRTH